MVSHTQDAQATIHQVAIAESFIGKVIDAAAPMVEMAVTIQAKMKQQ
jgi:hypothetical protein